MFITIELFKLWKKSFWCRSKHFRLQQIVKNIDTCFLKGGTNLLFKGFGIINFDKNKIKSKILI